MSELTSAEMPINQYRVIHDLMQCGRRREHDHHP